MILRIVENVLEADFSSDDVNDDSVEQIISNTEETWQKDRTEEEKIKNEKDDEEKVSRKHMFYVYKRQHKFTELRYRLVFDGLWTQFKVRSAHAG